MVRVRGVRRIAYLGVVSLTAALACAHPIRPVGSIDLAVKAGSESSRTSFTVPNRAFVSQRGELWVVAEQITLRDVNVEILTYELEHYVKYKVILQLAELIAFPAGVAFLGALIWRPSLAECDHDGDGSGDLGQYLWDLSTWLNPFEAAPVGDPNLRDRRASSRRGSREERRVVPAAGSFVEVSISAEGDRPVNVAAETDANGAAMIDLAPTIRGMRGQSLTLEVVTGDSAESRRELVLDADEIDRIVRQRFGGVGRN